MFVCIFIIFIGFIHTYFTLPTHNRWCALMLESLFPLADPEWEKPLVAVVFVGANDAALPSRQQHGGR